MVKAASASTPALTIKDHQIRALDTMCEELEKLLEYGTGTGKSAIIGKAAELFLSNGESPGLVIMPNALLEQIEEEFDKWVSPAWTSKNVQVLAAPMDLYQRRQHLKNRRKNIYVISTEALSYKIIREALSSGRWAWVMIDEASRFRNWSKRTGTLQIVGRRAESRYAFTGNLIARNPADCFYITNWLRPGCWGTQQKDAFIKKYFLLGGFTGTEPTGLRPDMEKEFFSIYDSLRIHCQLGDVRDLPDRVMTVRKTNLSGPQKQAYNQMRKELKVEIERLGAPQFQSKASTYATRLMRLQEIASGFTRNIDGEYVLLPSPKTEEMIDTLLDDPETPTVIWYWFQPERVIIENYLRKAGIPFVWLGEKNARQKFQAGDVNVFLSQNAKGGYGLNLQRAERMMYHSLPWDLDVYSQSQERNMRIDTPDPTKGFLEVIHYVARDTCDEYVRSRLVGKADMSRKFSRSQALDLLRKAV